MPVPAEPSELTSAEIAYWHQQQQRAVEEQYEYYNRIARQGQALFALAVSDEDRTEAQEAYFQSLIKGADRHGGRAGGKSQSCNETWVANYRLSFTYPGSRASLGGGGGGGHGKFSNKGIRAAIGRQEIGAARRQNA